MNPYAFVPLPAPARRESVRDRGHDHFSGLSGRLTCRLTAETHIFVPEYRSGSASHGKMHERLRFCGTKNRQYFIPGTSIKGVLRSVAEAVSGSCFIYDDLSYERNAIRYDLPPGYNHCTDVHRLCPACRMFGFLNHHEVFSGLVAISDATIMNETFQTETFTLAVLSTPKPQHRAFYASTPLGRTPAGRKFYYHHAPGAVKTRLAKDGQNKTVEAACPGASFTFEIEYTNLTDAELALLLYAVALEPEMRHKLGMGKPVGLGSVHIEVIGWQTLDRKARYTTLRGGLETVAADTLSTVIPEYIRRHGEALLQAAPMAELRRIWHWPPDPTVIIQYPNRQWFNDNPTAPLSAVQ